MATHLSKKCPYYNTKVPASRSKMDIEEMLKEFGAKAMRFTETPDSMQLKECPVLEFVLGFELKGVKKEIGVRMQVPLLAEKKRRYGRYGDPIYQPNMAASMRLQYWHLKAKLEAILYGVEDTMETFLSKAILQLADGSTMTVGEVIKEKPEVLSGLLPSFEIKSLPIKDRSVN